MNKNNLLVGLLIIVAVIVWGHNFYSIFLGVTAPDEEVYQPETDFLVQTNGSKLPEEDQNTFVYRAKYRDPFKPAAKRATQDAKVQKSKTINRPAPKATIPFPQLRFGGVIRDGQGLLALIHLPNGDSRFLSVGDSLQGVRILKVEDKLLKCSFQDREYELKLR